ncbi:winged helix-turn-helix transcriptional regulator [Puniceibacterium sediminis]|uniref:winged helix-turn-helix transcriptional regulator n=1 Tax=Puniceibacterium sediminis TaxID=1608407 RepID=UPI002481DC88|nr:winged helix-turn-helix transcriptional regulator [Puniceibacterium sediminis]
MQGETLRYRALRRAIVRISERVFSKTLNAPEIDVLVHREVVEVMPPHVEYCLTDLGVEAAERRRSLADWIEDSLPRVGGEWALRGVIGPDGSVRLPELTESLGLPGRVGRRSV